VLVVVDDDEEAAAAPADDPSAGAASACAGAALRWVHLPWGRASPRPPRAFQWAAELEDATFVETEYGLPPDASEREVRAYVASRRRSELRGAHEASRKGHTGKKRRRADEGVLESHSLEDALRVARELRAELAAPCEAADVDDVDDVESAEEWS
jgi:hypothetical protein